MEYRPLCQACHKRPAAINYQKDGKIHFRKKCDGCARKKRPKKTNWQLAGYVKKKQCERCGFKSKYHQQFFVYHTDGNLKNVQHTNLRTICGNCQIEIAVTGLGWKQGDLIPDY